LINLSLSSAEEWNAIKTIHTIGALINKTLTLCLTDQPWLTDVLKQLNRDELKVIKSSVVKAVVTGQVNNQQLQETIEQLFGFK